jgi:hypothetical protein
MCATKDSRVSTPSPRFAAPPAQGCLRPSLGQGAARARRACDHHDGGGNSCRRAKSSTASFITTSRYETNANAAGVSAGISNSRACWPLQIADSIVVLDDPQSQAPAVREQTGLIEPSLIIYSIRLKASGPSARVREKSDKFGEGFSVYFPYIWEAGAGSMKNLLISLALPRGLEPLFPP